MRDPSLVPHVGAVTEPVNAPAERSSAPSGTKASRREWIGLAVIALPCMLYSMDLTVLNLALPALARALRPTSAELLWIVDSYGFLLAGCLITMGMLGDRFGRRRVLLFGAVGFEVASVLAAVSSSAPMLIVARGLLGIAGATIAPSTLALIRSLFADPGERTFAIGVWAASFSVGAAIGPLAGGLLLEHFSWGSVFLLGIPVMVLLLLVGPRYLPEFRAEQPKAIDWPSAGLSALGVLPVVYGIKRDALGASGFEPALCISGGVAAGVLFFRRQRRISSPLVELSLFRNPAFTVALAANTLTLFVTFGTFVFVAQYFQQIHALSPLAAGLYTLPSATGFIVGSLLAPELAKRLAQVRVIGLSLLVVAGGLALLSATETTTALAWVIVSTVVLALGASSAVTMSTDLVVGSAPPDRAGAASAISETSGEFGAALGIAIFGTVAGAVYRSRMRELAGLPAAANHAALDTLAGALAGADRLSRADAELLLEHARRAFVEGMQRATLVSAVLALTFALLVFLRAGTKPGTRVSDGASVLPAADR